MTGRWDRTPMQLLEQQVRDLTAQLEQARKATDVATFRDMLSRAGIKYTEDEFLDKKTRAQRSRESYITLVEEDEDGRRVTIWFTPTGQLQAIVGK